MFLTWLHFFCLGCEKRNQDTGIIHKKINETKKGDGEKRIDGTSMFICLCPSLAGHSNRIAWNAVITVSSSGAEKNGCEFESLSKQKKVSFSVGDTPSQMLHIH